jgi:hypothetical protein
MFHPWANNFELTALTVDEKDLALAVDFCPPSIETVRYTPDRVVMGDVIQLQRDQYTAKINQAFATFLWQASVLRPTLKSVTVPSAFWSLTEFILLFQELANQDKQLFRRDIEDEREEIRRVGFVKNPHERNPSRLVGICDPADIVEFLEQLDTQRAQA